MMRRVSLPILSLAIAFALTGPAGATAAAEEDADHKKAVCPVCRVKEGTTVPETVHATRVHEGTIYGFCSEKCAREFDRDAALYVASAADPDSTMRAPLFERISSAPT